MSLESESCVIEEKSGPNEGGQVPAASDSATNPPTQEVFANTKAPEENRGLNSKPSEENSVTETAPDSNKVLTFSTEGTISEKTEAKLSQMEMNSDVDITKGDIIMSKEDESSSTTAAIAEKGGIIDDINNILKEPSKIEEKRTVFAEIKKNDNATADIHVVEQPSNKEENDTGIADIEMLGDSDEKADKEAIKIKDSEDVRNENLSQTELITSSKAGEVVQSAIVNGDSQNVDESMETNGIPEVCSNESGKLTNDNESTSKSDKDNNEKQSDSSLDAKINNDSEMGIQISTVTGANDVINIEEDKDKAEKLSKNPDSGNLSAMIISEPRTISNEEETVQPMEVDKFSEKPTSESTAPNKVENLLSENNGLGFKIVSVSAATDPTSETTPHNEAKKEETKTDGKENQPEEQKDADILEVKTDDSKKTENAEDSPQRVTRSKTGKIPPPVSPQTPPTTTKPNQTCVVCGKVGKCKYNIVRNGDVKHLCNDKCFKDFRSMPTKYLRPESKKKGPAVSKPKSCALLSDYKTCAVCQLMNINAASPFLSWSSLDFCGEECMTRYKKQMAVTCGLCSKVLPPSQRATFCLKSGNETKQFCGSDCYLKFKEKKKACTKCSKDLLNDPNAFVAPSGPKGEFLDFCSQTCMKAYEKPVSKPDNDIEIIGVEPQAKEVACAVCMKITKPKHELTFEGKLHKMCSDPCYSAFQYANKLTSNTCDKCGIYCYGEGSSPQFIQFEGHQKRFCGTTCMNSFRAANRKMILCAWCGSRKSNFDMIERVDANNKYQLFCSLNCLSLYRVNLQATSNQSVTCDQCRKFVPAQYHLTMSDASVRNFCSYNCVMTFQGQFGQPNKKTPTANQANKAMPSPKSTPPPTKPTVKVPSTPNVVTQAKTQTANIKSPVQVPVVISGQGTKVITGGNQQRIIIQPPPPKLLKNKAMMCKPYTQTRATSCRPATQSTETQSDIEPEKKIVYVPVPVPIYIPTPMAMYTAPAPLPIPIPVPIPIPCFIPTTKKSAEAILNHIKEIRERTPDDPFQAELLRMADAVANAEKTSDAESDHDVSMNETGDGDAAVDTNTGESPEDMLEMALRLATEMSDELEQKSAPAINNVTDNQSDDPNSQDDGASPRATRPKGRQKATKRESSSRGTRRSKRQKVDSDSENVSEKADDGDTISTPTPASAPALTPAPAVVQPPDSNFLLKYMYGVNAWKHWVVQKNAQLEKVMKQGSGRVKLFKTDILQCVADELNYSLCLFVKEVRKPNGDEYAADSILYLCLGIQNFLFENGRIDNIFTDIYYEKFTECLNEVVQRFQPKLNPAGQLVCRIEEEHLWECKQLGAHSPHVLLNTLVYLNTKYFLLQTPMDHMKLSFSHIVKQWKKKAASVGSKAGGGRCFSLKYVVQASQKDKQYPLEQSENLDDPLRCPVKLYEFYLSKCSYFSSPEAIKTRNDVFYLVPERSCVPDSPVWYSNQAMPIEPLAKMLNRIHLVKEVQEAFMNA